MSKKIEAVPSMNKQEIQKYYTQPQLLAYGHLSTLTQGSFSSTNDSGGSQNGKFPK